MKRKQRKFTAEQKAAILKRHWSDKLPVSDVCEEAGIQPSVFYAWQKQLMDNMAATLERGGSKPNVNGHSAELSRQNESLKAQLAKKDSICLLYTSDAADE